jgi:hypothetical protein
MPISSVGHTIKAAAAYSSCLSAATPAQQSLARPKDIRSPRRIAKNYWGTIHHHQPPLIQSYAYWQSPDYGWRRGGERRTLLLLPAFAPRGVRSSPAGGDRGFLLLPSSLLRPPVARKDKSEETKVNGSMITKLTNDGTNSGISPTQMIVNKASMKSSACDPSTHSSSVHYNLLDCVK